MALDKILHKMQGQINDIAPTLELFVDDTIQPSADDCEKLQHQIAALQESLAVYKYHKLNTELSPSFNIHAKISALKKAEEKPVEPAPQIKDVVIEEKAREETPVETKHSVPGKHEYERHEPVKPKANIAIGLNDKFRFMNELFSQNASEYNIALEQLSNLHNWNDTEVYLNSLKNLYDWKENHDVVKHFYSVLKRRFD